MTHGHPPNQDISYAEDSGFCSPVVAIAFRIGALFGLILYGPAGWALLAGSFAAKLAYRTFANAYLHIVQQSNDQENQSTALIPFSSSNAPQPRTSTSMIQHIPGASYVSNLMKSNKEKEQEKIREAINDNLKTQLEQLTQREITGVLTVNVQFSDQKKSASQEETFRASAMLRITIPSAGAAPQIQGISAIIDHQSRPLSLQFTPSEGANSTALTTTNQDLGTALMSILPKDVVSHCQSIRSAAILEDSQHTFTVFDVETEKSVSGANFSSSSGAGFGCGIKKENIDVYIRTLQVPDLLENRHLWDSQMKPISTVEIEDVTNVSEVD